MPDAALERLLSLGGELYTPPGQPRRKFDLEHMRQLLLALGSPQQAFRCVLVAGTNGKGSTAATLASILAVGGYTTGLYTSPHLQRVNERIQLSQPPAHSPLFCEIDDEQLFRHLAEVEQAGAALVESGQLPDDRPALERMTADIC